MVSETARRLGTPPERGAIPADLDMSAICYWQNGGIWWLYLPGGGIGNLPNHDVTEHEDGTITVSPSVLMTSNRADRRRHGFLRKGVWEPCGDDIAPPRAE